MSSGIKSGSPVLVLCHGDIAYNCQNLINKYKDYFKNNDIISLENKNNDSSWLSNLFSVSPCDDSDRELANIKKCLIDYGFKTFTEFMKYYRKERIILTESYDEEESIYTYNDVKIRLEFKFLDSKRKTIRIEPEFGKIGYYYSTIEYYKHLPCGGWVNNFTDKVYGCHKCGNVYTKEDISAVAGVPLCMPKSKIN